MLPRPRRRQLIGAAAIALASALGGFLAEHEQREAASEALAMATLMRTMEVAPLLGDNDRVSINGAAVVFRISTFQGSPESALDAVARECASGDSDLALGLRSVATEGGTHPIVLDHVRRESAPMAAATLCTFRHDDPQEQGRAPRARFVLARQHGAQSSVVSIATTGETSLEAMFPSEGDAPGGDLDGFPRPRDARRTFVAALGARAVRIYEARTSLARAVQMNDEDAFAAGFVKAPASEAVGDDARLYTRGEVDVVASFREVDGLAVVTLTKLSGVAATPGRNRSDLPPPLAEVSWP